jgi:hypothetical protein
MDALLKTRIWLGVMTVGCFSWLVGSYRVTGHLEDERRNALSQQEAAFNKSVDESYAALQETDLNMDGVPDLVLNLGDGRKIPLYGLKSPDGTVRNYLAGAKMKDLFSDSPVDYEGIAARLNQE